MYFIIPTTHRLDGYCNLVATKIVCSRCKKKAGQSFQCIPIKYISNEDVAPFYYIRLFLSVCLNVKFSAFIKAKDSKIDMKGSVISGLLLIYYYYTKYLNQVSKLVAGYLNLARFRL